MKRRRAEIVRAISGTAGIFAVAVAVLLPFGFYAIGHGALEAATQMEADLKSEIVSPFISENPDLWRFSADRLTNMVQRSSHVTGDEMLRVLDRRGEEVVKIGGPLAPPLMVRSAPLFDAGVAAGRLEVIRSLRALVYKTMAMAVASAVIAAALFATFRMAPMHALTRALQELAREKERAEATLHALGDGIITTDVRGAIDYVNPAALALLGCAAQALVGKSIDEALKMISKTTRAHVANPLLRAIAEKRPIEDRAQTLLVRPDRDEIAVDAMAAPVRDAQGEVVGGVLVLRKSG